MIDYVNLLNEEQREAVTATPGPILVVAGAGSGKTRALTYRVAYLLDNGVEPSRIVLATFTNKAARQMLERVGQLIPHGTEAIWGGTFHHLAHRLLRRHAALAGYDPSFTILDRADSAELLSECYEEMKLSRSEVHFPRREGALEIFGLATNRETPLDKLIAEDFPHFAEQTERLVELARLYRKRKQKASAVDYDDLLSEAVRLLRDQNSIREEYQDHFHHILVDEYQDTSRLQAEFIHLLAAGHRQIMAVGDDAQSIYSWRGADIRNMLAFPERYPECRVLYLRANYRSTPEILSLANAAIAANRFQFPKELAPVRNSHRLKPAVVSCPTANVQASFVASQIQTLRREGVSWEEIAILYRAHFHALEVQLELTRAGIPFEITSGLRFFEQAHLKDVAAFLRLATNPRDSVAFSRVVRMFPGVGEKTANRLWEEFSRKGDLSAVSPPKSCTASWNQWISLQREIASPELRQLPAAQIEKVIDGFYREQVESQHADAAHRLEDLSQLVSFAAEFPDTDSLLTQLTLLTNTDRSNSREGVHLSTIHQAKGLEWRTVFVIMLADGLFPSSRSTESLMGEEEERRLFYVATTRAQDHLFLVYPRYRASHYGENSLRPSRFLAEIPRELYSDVRPSRIG
ncbi:ATP-dependent helicase [Methylacidimicrobium tartarophylax]|uniref:DNA 3'-5' helicase n=1 Tax=Methylacidimicrobium tartarophylax TaxID=1041768 RepID=A0A5E6M748_9BACT|nr:ATP-dependent helicase [Methylacidimicrobium tartarophylax]VVM04761.1 ATP-dependent DNA helicase PcrA [Methylacidimicrobium tartarophylax]